MLSEKKTKQALLITKILPLLASTPNFALKGGTAINYFALDLPRISTDIDLAFIPILPRDQSIAAIEDGLKTLAATIEKSIPEAIGY